MWLCDDECSRGLFIYSLLADQKLLRQIFFDWRWSISHVSLNLPLHVARVGCVHMTGSVGEDCKEMAGEWRKLITLSNISDLQYCKRGNYSGVLNIAK